MKKVHAEIEYYSEERGINIHSDMCPFECNFENISSEYRKYLHDSLDEWLDKSNGTGAFYIKAEEHEIANLD